MTILRPPLADELALVGTIRAHNPPVAYGTSSFQNLGFYSDQLDESLPPTSASHWIELQPTMINTASLAPADYDIHSYPSDDYLSSDPFRRSELILPPAAQRLDTSTGVYNANYLAPAPKSILKSNPTPPLHSFSTDSSKYDESPRTSVKINPTPSVFLDYPTEPVRSATMPMSSKHRMEFASFSQLNHVEWEIPSELQTIMCDLSNENPSDARDEDTPHRTRTQSATPHVSRVFVPWEQTGQPPRSQPLFDEHRTRQQAFEY